VRIHAVEGGFGHGLVHLWAEDGTLLGTASQSAMVRSHREHGEEAPK
jgi:acyl-CoA thioesterase